MKIFSSLTNRIFVATAALAVLAITMAVYRVNVAATTQAEGELHRGLEEAGTLLEEYRATLFQHIAREARLVADLPRLKAAMALKDPPTVQPLADEYQRLIGSDLFVVTDPAGRLLAEVGILRMQRDDPAARDAIARSTRGHEAVSLWAHGRGAIQVVSVPSFVSEELVGTLSVGFSLDEQAAANFKALTNSDIAIAIGNRVQVSTLPAQYNDRLEQAMSAGTIDRMRLGNNDYVAVSRALRLAPSGTNDTQPAATALILRSRTERLRFLDDVHRDLAGTAILAVFAATLLSYAVARTVTRPLGAITATMREMATTGDLTRRIALPSRATWQDEDARLLATTFNSMTDSIGRFQREAAQRERLSSLGRLSTVVAHEIRNPLMIIKTALRGLKRDRVTPDELGAAVADIDEEVARLNRIVQDVLDFARPITFEMAPVDLNALCEDAAKASTTDTAGPKIALDLDRAVHSIVTDGERLRIALVNILTNARHAVAARPEAPLPRRSGDAGDVSRRSGAGANAGGGEPIRLSTSQNGVRVAIDIRDRGIGISPDDLPRVFDPYFTTRRTGTGLGLAITRNIIESMGGSITVSSRPGEGTNVQDRAAEQCGSMMMTAGSILLVDDEAKILNALASALRGEGHEVVATGSAREAQRLLTQRLFDLLIVDNLMPDLTGLDVIRELVASTQPGERPQILMMTAHATVESAIEAMKLGALDYLQKPFEIDELIVVVRRALDHQRLRTEHRYLISERDAEFNHYGIVGRSRRMQEVIHTAQVVARSKSTVLITGETGTGKEMVARAIHDHSAQREMPLIKVNCAAIPETLLESELFGHVRGAFTGATTSKKGKFALADGGTIFLDEIGTMSPALQAKLLRVLQEREFEPLGAERTQKVDVRVIAATNRDLRQMVADGRFQEDLYYRLNVIPIHIAPLRERRDDIPVLVEHFIGKHAQRAGKRIEGLEPGVLDALRNADWPGNVRELENTVERAVVLSQTMTIGSDVVRMLGVATASPASLPSLNLRQNLEWAERETVRRALDTAGGVKKDAAEVMGISQRALSYYLAKHRVE